MLIYLISYQNILDVNVKDLAQDNAFILSVSGLSYIAVWLTWWVLSGYQLYLVFGAIRDKEFPSSKAVMPFLFIQVAILLLLTFWPGLVLLLPRLVYG